MCLSAEQETGTAALPFVPSLLGTMTLGGRGLVCSVTVQDGEEARRAGTAKQSTEMCWGKL